VADGKEPPNETKGGLEVPLQSIECGGGGCGCGVQPVLDVPRTLNTCTSRTASNEPSSALSAHAQDNGEFEHSDEHDHDDDDDEDKD
jgi:hypothetical protein